MTITIYITHLLLVVTYCIYEYLIFLFGFHMQKPYMTTVEATWRWPVWEPQLASLPPILHHTSPWCLDSLIRLQDYTYEPLSLDTSRTNRFLDWCVFFCRVPGVWYSHAAALPMGPVRPEEQTSSWGQRACRGGSPGAAHWDVSGQQQWLCHQPHQRLGTQDLHCHSRLGDWRVQVCKKHALAFGRRNFCYCILLLWVVSKNASLKKN